MFGSNTLEVAIGIVFVYLLLSLFCTAVNESIAATIQQRGKNLKAGLQNLLNDPDFTALAQQLYSHGLVCGVSKDATNPAKPNRLPSYLSPTSFSLALLDILGSREAASDANGIVSQRQAIVNQAQNDLNANPNDLVLNKALDTAQIALDEAKTKAALLTVESSAEQTIAIGRSLAALHPDPMGNIRKAIQSLPAGHTKESLLVLVDKTDREIALVPKEIAICEAQIEALRENLEQWFNDATDRFAGWYKRWTQLISFSVAALIVVIGNVDTIKLTDRLLRDNALRASVVTAATGAVQHPETTKNVLDEANKLGIPVGWSLSTNLERLKTGSFLHDPFGLMAKAFGLFISILAVSMGAPFWFDTLSKFMNIRSAGKPPKPNRKS
jgi:hypothetical protein